VGGGGGALSVLWILLRMVTFLAVGLLLGMRFIPRLSVLVSRLPISEGLMSFVIAVTLFYAWAAEALGGVASITGAFLAGILFSRTPLRRSIETGMHTIAYSWLVPIFFVSIGLQTNLRAVGLAGIPLALAILAAAILSKVVGCGVGARAGGCTTGEALRLGVGMTSRGEVGLIVATVGLAAGLVNEAIFASAVLMVLITSLATPIALRALYPKSQTSQARTEPAEAKRP
jgi:Kef-type K+ transport system membrane component KefB